MTLAEVTKLVAAVQALWPHQRLARETPSVWMPFLANVAYADADAAVRELAVEGREWPPPIGVIVKTISPRATDGPDWDEARADIDRLIRKFGYYRLPPVEAFSHPAIAAWARPAWRELCMGPAPGTRDYGIANAQNRESYRALRARAERDHGLEAIGAARRNAPGRIGDATARLIPAQKEAA